MFSDDRGMQDKLFEKSHLRSQTSEYFPVTARTVSKEISEVHARFVVTRMKTEVTKEYS